MKIVHLMVEFHPRLHASKPISAEMSIMRSGDTVVPIDETIMAVPMRNLWA